jgi:hypothetical protein
MSDSTQFTIGNDEGFYVTVAEAVTVYEAYADAVGDIRDKLQADADGFLAEVAIEDTEDSEDVAITLEQVGWQQIIRDMESVHSASPEAEVSSDADD